MIDVRIAKVSPDADPGECRACGINPIQVVVTIELAHTVKGERRKVTTTAEQNFHVCNDCALKIHVVMGISMDSFFDGRSRVR